MTLTDTDTGRVYSLRDLYDEWLSFRSDEPWNHSIDFPTEFFEIMMDTVNGRNDLDVTGLTQAEISRYILRLGSAIGAFNMSTERK